MHDHRRLISDLKAVVGDFHVLHEPGDLIAFEQDGSVGRELPVAVAVPASTAEVAGVVRAARRHAQPVVARGAGTGLSGGAVARGGVVVALTRMRRIVEVDAANRFAVVEAGLVNLDLSMAVAGQGLAYAPDPSSQRVCTIGGNVAENAGGPHCLAHGVTTNHVLGMEVVLADGSVTWLGATTREAPGYDLRGVVVGSEGMLAVVTRVAVRLVRRPEAVRTSLAVYRTLDDASGAVSAIVAAGIVPAAVEMMDAVAIQAVEAAMHAGYPEGAAAVLLVEVDGLRESVDEEAAEVEALCRRHDAVDVLAATDARDRERLWAGRKGALGALGRLAPNYYLLDGTVPRTKLLDVMRGIARISREAGLPVANVLHAGDGNLHPCVLFDERDPDETRRALRAGGEILKLCVEAGGVLSGEHGIGSEKREYMPLMFSEADMAAMAGLQVAFESAGVLNPGKVFPTGAACGEIPRMGSVARAGLGAFV